MDGNGASHGGELDGEEEPGSVESRSEGGAEPAGDGYALGQAAAQTSEDPYELRLTALLHQLVRSRGHKGAARALGLDPRTVAGSVREGMSRRVRDVVEKMLVERDGAARDELEDAVEELAGQVGGLTTRVVGLENELREGLKALGEAQARGMRRLEQRLIRAETRWQAGNAAVPAADGHPLPGGGAPPPRRHPDLVTVEPADDDEDVFGNAWSLVAEWRKLWEGHPAQGRGLDWVSRRERILTLEVAMLEEHGLTLPPETEPLRGLDRGAQLNWRVKALRDFRRRRARLAFLGLLGWLLSLGRWRG